MNKKKILSLIMALVMLVGVFSPLTTLAADGTVSKEKDAVTNTVTLHKLMMTKEELKAWKSEEIEKAGYSGIQDIDSFKKFLSNGHTAHEVAGVYFALKFADDYGTTADEKKMAGKYVKASSNDKLTPADPLEATDKVDEAVGGLTTANGIKLVTSKLKGKFVIDEIKDKSTYKNDGKTIVDQRAVPVKITLPLVNNDGTVLDAHVYPKNTEDKPVIDKNFKKAKSEDKELKKAEGFPEAANGAGIGVGANYDNYQKNKATAKVSVGDVVPYEVKTKIAAETSYEKLVWNDIMTNGLTYNKDLGISKHYKKENNSYVEDKNATDLVTGIKVLVDNQELKDPKNSENPYLVKDTDYKIVEDDKGFRLQFEKSGLDKIAAVTKTHEEIKEGQKTTVAGKDVEIELTYTATVNGTAKVDNPEKNNVTLEYGHKPGKDLEKKPVTPKDGKLKVTKKVQDNGDAADPTETNAKNLKLVYTLRKGDKAYSVALTVANKASTDPIDLGNGIKFTVTGLFAGEFSGLGEDTTGWTIEERVAGYNPAYSETNAAGQVTITNKKDNDNPPPLEPTVPQVVVGGKKFVKTDDNKENPTRLLGAQFVVKKVVDNKTLYLVSKADATKSKDQAALLKAEDAYRKAIDLYNEAIKKATGANTAEKEANVTIKLPKPTQADPNATETITGKTNIEKKIADLRVAYEKAFKTAGTLYDWKDSASDANIVKLSSDAEGRFEIQGLAYGSYALEEIKTPEGFAKISDVEFTVAKGENDADVNIKYETTDTKNNAKQVVNKKVTIPQTGGIGTVLFTVVGLGLMAGAVMAMKKNREEA